MDIKKRIDGLTEQEAKAALWAVMRSKGAFLYITEHEKTIDEYAIFELEAALKEVPCIQWGIFTILLTVITQTI